MLIANGEMQVLQHAKTYKSIKGDKQERNYGFPHANPVKYKATTKKVQIKKDLKKNVKDNTMEKGIGDGCFVNIHTYIFPHTSYIGIH